MLFICARVESSATKVQNARAQKRIFTKNVKPFQKYYVKSPQYLSGILKKLLIITKNVLNVSKNHLNISYFCRKYVPILNHLKFLAVAGVEEEDSGASMLSTSAAIF